MKRAAMRFGEPIPPAVMQADLPIRSGVAIPGGFTRGESVHFSLTWLGADMDAVTWDWPRWGRRILVSRNRPRWEQEQFKPQLLMPGPMRHDGLPMSAFVPPGYHVEAGWKPKNGKYVQPGEIVPIYPLP